MGAGASIVPAAIGESLGLARPRGLASRFRTSQLLARRLTALGEQVVRRLLSSRRAKAITVAGGAIR